MVPSRARYDRIGAGYAEHRHEDPALRARIEAGLGDAVSVVNVGAGTGLYESSRRRIVAVEPSPVMIAQRTRSAAVVRALAGCLPLADDSVDAALTVLSLHHWDEGRRAGVCEMRRVARRTVVIVTIDARVSNRMWLPADYFPELAALDARIFPPPETICEWMGGGDVEVVPVSRHTPDGMLLSLWAHPERVLDPEIRAATSGFARQPTAVVERIERRLRDDLASGAWDARHGHLRDLDEYDAGLRLITAGG